MITSESFNAIDICRAGTALQLFDEVRAMTWRLVNPTH